MREGLTVDSFFLQRPSPVGEPRGWTAVVQTPRIGGGMWARSVNFWARGQINVGERCQLADSALFFFFLWYVLLQPQVQIGWIYYATACLWQFLLQTGSKLALLITHCFPFLLERIAVQTTTTLWALSTWFCSGFRKSIPWFGWTKMLLKPVCCQSWTGVQHGGVLN